MPSEVKKLRHLEDENARLKKLVVDHTLDNGMPAIGRTSLSTQFDMLAA